MLIKIKKKWELPESEVTDQNLYRTRRDFIKGAGLMTAAAALAACRPERPPEAAVVPGDAAVVESGAAEVEAVAESEAAAANVPTDELGDVLTSFEDVTNYNNYYEFTTDKVRVAQLAQDFTTSPWEIEVGGLVNNPGTFGVEDILADYVQEERIYRLRCVEAWSMVIPWQGFPLSQLLKKVEPTSKAKYVRFETVNRPEEMPGMRTPWYQWPYIEGLRLDEAMHDLTILSTGLYGDTLLPQNGAPIRLVVPWKYGFKSIKSIVKIDLVEEQPTSLWMAASPNEYGFYSNVNPDVRHPRWSQAAEQRIGEAGRRTTLMFNGYEEQVASLYDGMDLRANF